MSITLDVPQSVSDSTLTAAPRSIYEGTLNLLKSKGFDAHIYDTSETEFMDTSCGVLSPETRRSLTLYTKRPSY